MFGAFFTGSSIAVLMDGESKEVELMISHAWGGSVVETYNCLQNMVNHCEIPQDAWMFFCTFSMYQAYQPEDTTAEAAAGGLSIDEQLKLTPFAKIIASKPTHGMFVIHTTVFEVYSRMWTVHEVDEGTESRTRMRGLFDMYRWTRERFNSSLAIDTSKSECLSQDKSMLEALIAARGGFARLDQTIIRFREQMRIELEELLKMKHKFESTRTASTTGFMSDEKGRDYDSFKTMFDWNHCITLMAKWDQRGECIPSPSGSASLLPSFVGVTRSVEWGYTAKWGDAFPLGEESYPFGVQREYRRPVDDAVEIACNHYRMCCFPCAACWSPCYWCCCCVICPDSCKAASTHCLMSHHRVLHALLSTTAPSPYGRSGNSAPPMHRM